MVTRRKPKESDVRAGVKKWLDLTGWYYYSNLQGMGCKLGLADMTIVKNGIVVWVELKAPGKKQSPKQIGFEMEIRNAGGHYVCVDSAYKLADWLHEMFPDITVPMIL